MKMSSAFFVSRKDDAMNVFEAVKQNVTTRQAAELYGIRVGRNGMAVIEFMNTRNSIQKKMRQSLTVLNYKQNGYVQNTKTTQMILHYYHNIPDQRPSQKWFDGIILLVKKFYGNC